MRKVEAKRSIRYTDKKGSVSWVLAQHEADINSILKNVSDISVVKNLIIDLIKEEAVLEGTTAQSYIDTIKRFSNRDKLCTYITNVRRAGYAYLTDNVPYMHKSRNQLI